jgi:mono/diheme cytochrome c family protein
MRIGGNSLLALVLVCAGCGAPNETVSPVVDRAAMSLQGDLELDAIVWMANPRTLTAPGDLHAYTLRARAGAVVTLRVRAEHCVARAPALILFGPSRGTDDAAIAWSSDDGPLDCDAGSAIERFALPEDGEYLVVVAQRSAGHYQLDASCDTAPCAPPGAMTFAQSKVAQVNDAEVLDETGAFLFRHVHRLAEGLGNGRGGPGPHMRAVHLGPFGGPDAQSCVSCHNQGVGDGSGGLGSNIYQAGDGATKDSALVRNPPSLFGAGVRQAMADEITSRLQGRFRALVADTAGARIERDLCVTDTSPVCFHIVAERGQVISADGIDPDLVVRPFGWKGREATLRDFARGGFRVHFGIQDEDKIAAYCAGPRTDPERFERTWGGGGCEDPDEDGVDHELTAAQLSATATYLALLPAPSPAIGVRLEGDTPHPGQSLLVETCGGCHVPRVVPLPGTLDDPKIGLTLELSAETGVDVWSDFKRHAMGDALWDSRAFDNYPAADIPHDHFITPPLWDVANTAPYMHDGSAPTLEDAIEAHGGEHSEAAAALARFRDLSPADRKALIDFLGTLGAGDHPPHI